MDDAKKMELLENFSDRRDVLLTKCHEATQLQERIEQEPENSNLPEALMQYKMHIKKMLKEHEDFLESDADMMDTEVIKYVEGTIEFVKKEIEEWKN